MEQDDASQTSAVKVNHDYVLVNGIPLPSTQVRKNITIAIMLFCMVMISVITFIGDDKNSLHVSAMSWSFTILAATFFAYCFGSVIDNFNVLKNK